MTRVGGVKGLKPKDLCLIPFRLAISAQEDGWWVRSVIIWSKPNPMPESVKDRPTESHEYILMLTKSARYYWDADAVRETYTEPLNRWGGDKTKPTDTTKDIDSIFAVQEREGRERRPDPGGRNLRSVWSFPTVPYPRAHFAVFPEKLPELCIKASTPEEGYKATQEEIERYPGNHPDPGYSRTVGWRPSCKCNAPRVPSLVLDPLMGAGTTLLVAKKLNRRAVGYEISKEYCELAIERCRQQVLL